MLREQSRNVPIPLQSAITLSPLGTAAANSPPTRGYPLCGAAAERGSATQATILADWDAIAWFL